ncbi:hypothetical protein C0989_006633, partial [Termitomyces sp. Mn162]
QFMEIQRELCHPHSVLHPALISNLCYPALACPMPAFTLAIPVVRPLLPGILIDLDAARQLCTALLLCQRCQKPGHFAWHCPLGLEVCYLSTAEQEELLLQLLAAKDAARALSLDEPTLELTLEEISTCTSPLELEEDF